jgi:hypothetical protein
MKASSVAKCDMADIGNYIPSSHFAFARNVYHEGALVFPGVHIQRDRKNIEDIMRMFRARHPRAAPSSGRCRRKHSPFGTKSWSFTPPSSSGLKIDPSLFQSAWYCYISPIALT